MEKEFCEKHQMWNKHCKEWQKKGMLDECETQPAGEIKDYKDYPDCTCGHKDCPKCSCYISEEKPDLTKKVEEAVDLAIKQYPKAVLKGEKLDELEK